MLYRPFVLQLAAALIVPCTLVFAQPVLITQPQTLNPGATTITPTAGGPPVPLQTADITVSDTTLTVNGRHTIRSLVVQGSFGFLTHDPAFTFDYSGGKGLDVVHGLWLSITPNGGVGGDLTLQSNGRIDANGRGYPGGQGPGAGGSTSGVASCGNIPAGAGHGGSGGFGSLAEGGLTYGDYARPATMGSGGGNRGSTLGAPGGGTIRLIVGGTLTLNWPTAIMADGWGIGAGVYSGAGAGGSVWINAARLAGSGFIHTDGGGNTCGTGGGGGGRIAVYADDLASFTGSVSAYTASSSSAGCGTLYLAPTGQQHQLIFDNGGTNAGITALPAPLEVPEGINFIVRGQARVGPRPNDPAGLVIDIADNLTIESNGSIDATGRGYPRGQGPGAGGSSSGAANCSNAAAGGGHGGSGGPGSLGVGGLTYGDLTQPSTMGSGGGNHGVTPRAAGGGVIRLIVGETLTVSGANAILADGEAASAIRGAGAGGSVWITAGQVAGSGVVRANGGSAACGTNGGGGGRVAVYACSSSLTPAQLRTDRGSSNAGDGTIYTSGLPLTVRYASNAPQCRGDSVSLVAITPHAESFQWLRNGVDLADGPSGFGSFISGAQTATLTITNVQANDRGPYTVRVNNACGLVTSAPLNMTLCAADHNCDGTVNSTDVSDFINQWFQDQLDGTLITDWDANGVVNSTDVSSFINTWFGDTAAGCG